MASNTSQPGPPECIHVYAYAGYRRVRTGSGTVIGIVTLKVTNTALRRCVSN